MCQDPPLFVLAAGEGTRMRPLTLTRPKPLLEVAGRSLLDRALDRGVDAGLTRAVVNAWYLGDQIVDHIARHWVGHGQLAVQVSREPADAPRLETAGGALYARSLLGPGPFLAANGDALWLDGPAGPALRRLIQGFDEARMDALMLLVPRAAVTGLDGPGDYHLGDDGRLTRRRGDQSAEFFYAGLQLAGTGLLAGVEPGPRSFNPLWDRAQAAGRLYGLIHDGAWYHVGTPQELAATSRALSARPGP